jgi:hypothetical protein
VRRAGCGVRGATCGSDADAIPHPGALNMEVLSCAAVGFHVRVVLQRSAACAVLLLVGGATARGQSASFQDLASELAAKIAAVVSPGGAVLVTSIPVDAADEAPLQQVVREVARVLTARGDRLVASEAAAVVVAVGCTTNLRERVCLAEVRRSETRQVVSASKAHDGRTSGDADPTLALEAAPLFAQRAAILDVAPLGDRLLVLDPAAITLYRRADDGWQRVESRAIGPARVWPRDVRGRLRASGSAIEAFLPGAVCRGPVDLSLLTCVDEREPWPLAVDNAGIDAARNYFQTPEGVSFVGAAALGADGDARWALADLSGTLILMDERRKPLGAIGSSDDVAGLTARCRPGAYLLASSRLAGADTETLRLLRVVGRHLLTAATPLVMPGRLTALWAAPGASVATVIAHDAGAGRYEAFQVSISCAR